MTMAKALALVAVLLFSAAAFGLTSAHVVLGWAGLACWAAAGLL